MSPTVFAYIVLFTLLLAAAAAAVERGTQGGGAARHFWTAAIVLAVVAPSGALAWHSFADRATTTGMTVAGGPDKLATIVISSVISSGRYTVHRAGGFIGRDALIRMLLPSRRAIDTALARLNRNFSPVAMLVWVCLSVALLVWLAIGLFHWRRAQSTWQRTTLDGVSVDVSATTGPAVVGLLSHRIVLPSWATTMQPEHRQLILAHEGEHINARDPERLVLAIGALILMPWNIGLWWCAARLRRAIELDCDTRVLRRFPNAKEYGCVLLEVALRGRYTGPLAVPMVALLRLPSELELRLRAMTRARAVGMRGVIAGGIAAIVAITVAFTTPVPSIATHGVGLRAVPRASSSANIPIPLRDVSSDTGSKRRADSLAILKAENDSLRTMDRALMAQLRLTSGNRAWLDSARTALALVRHNEETAQRGFQQSEKPRVGNSYTTYFEFQVTKPAHTLATAITPTYPASLRQAGVGGEVDAQFVVDTLGRVDTGTIKITSATDPAFESAVRTVLPKMRFAPAEIHGRRVKQLVQQPFTFQITKAPE